jgi:hypothetical protein
MNQHFPLLFAVAAVLACSTDPVAKTDTATADTSTNEVDATATTDATPDTADAAQETAADVPPDATTASAAKLVINEVAAQGQKDTAQKPLDGDWTELWNGTGSAIDLQGWRMGGLGNGFAGATPLPKVSIAAKGYLVVYWNHKSLGVPVIDKRLKSDGTVGLWEPNGMAVDLLDWEEGQSPPGKSWGRSPDGGSVFKTFDAPTPGSANP